MDTGEWAVIGVSITAIATVLGSWLTRRSAKDTAGVSGLVALNTGLEKRVERLESREERRSELAGKHREWDELVRDKLHALGEQVPIPPPLD